MNRKSENILGKSKNTLISGRIEVLKKELGLNIKGLEDGNGPKPVLSNGSIAKWNDAYLEKPTRMVLNFLNYWGINQDWWRTGKGDPLNRKGTRVENSEARQINPSEMQVPFVSQYAYAGYLSGFQDDTFMESLPTVPFIVDMEGKGKYVCFEVRGDSMNDGSSKSYEEGDHLYCREIYQTHWQNKIHIKKWANYVIVHRTNGILVKQITSHNTETNEITIHSLNPAYDDKTIPLADVAQLFNVVRFSRGQNR